MRALHVHSGNLYGGVETFLITMARCRHLAPSMEMSVALCFEGRLAEELRAERVPTPMLGEARLRRPDTVWRARRALEAVLQRGRYDVVVCHQAWPLAVFGPAVKAAALPLVSWVHMDQSGRHWLERLASRVHPDLIICNSRFTASGLPAHKTRVEWIHYPAMPIDRGVLKPRADVRKELQTDPNDAVIIQVSRMERLKGQAVCIDALALLRDRPNWTCWQVGGAQRDAETRYLDSLQGAAERLGVLNRIRFVGQRSDVPDLLAAADIFCQPNLQPDAFGLSFIEALSARLPVVTSNIGGALEIIDDTCGILTSPGDAHALAAALMLLLDDRSERERLGNSGPGRAHALCDPLTQMTRIAETLETVSCRDPVH